MSLHEKLHKLPWMPPHSEAERHNARRRSARRNPTAHHANPPRVLKGWQERIGRLFGQDPR